MIKKITLYCVFKDIMKCFIAACGITLLIIFFGDQALFYEDVKVFKQFVQVVTSCIFTILLIGTLIWRIVEKWICRKEICDSVYRIEKAEVIGSAISGKTEITTTTRSQAEIQTIRIHESGHAVMAHLQGFQVIECITFATPEQAPYTRYDTPDNPATIEQYENIILVCYAGAVSEILVNGKFRSGCVGFDGKSDFEMAEMLIRNLLLLEDNEFGYTTGGEAFEKAVRERSKKLFDKTMEILSGHQYMIQKVVDALESKNNLTGGEIAKILNRDEDEEYYESI